MLEEEQQEEEYVSDSSDDLDKQRVDKETTGLCFLYLEKTVKMNYYCLIDFLYFYVSYSSCATPILVLLGV